MSVSGLEQARRFWEEARDASCRECSNGQSGSSRYGSLFCAICLGASGTEQGVSKDVYVVSADQLFKRHETRKRAVVDLSVSIC